MKKVCDVLLKIFAYGIIACVFAGGFSLFGYFAGLIIGGETATNLCEWLFRTYLPWVIKATSFFTLIGLIGMYFSRQKVLTAKIEKEQTNGRA